MALEIFVKYFKLLSQLSSYQAFQPKDCIDKIFFQSRSGGFILFHFFIYLFPAVLAVLLILDFFFFFGLPNEGLKSKLYKRGRLSYQSHLFSLHFLFFLSLRTDRLSPGNKRLASS
jgi:hypothetical protein